MIKYRNIYTNIFLLIIVLSIGIPSAQGQTLTDYAKKHKAELAEKQKAEREAYEAACTKGTMEALKAFVSNYPKSKYVTEANSKIKSLEQKIEKDAYDSACKTGTIDAFRGFLKKYPQSQYALDVQNRIKDYDLWSVAKKNNTIQAYNTYLQNSKLQTFASEAKAAIEDINAVAEWQTVKSTNSLSDVQAYMRKYPNASSISDAKKKEHELKGVQYYNSGNLASAYREFTDAGGKYSISFSNRDAYDKCQEYHDFSLLSSYSKEAELNAFLTKYPNSKYTNQISNWIAIAKAKAFSMYTEDYTYKAVLSYAKDDATRNQVKAYYEAKRKEYSQYKKERRAARRRANGGIVNFGLELLDFGFNHAFSDRVNDILYYNVGISIKFGNYISPVQLELGIKPGLLSYVQSDDYDAGSGYYSYYDRYYGYNYDYYDYNDYETYNNFHMPLYARMKINLFNAGSNSKCYIDGMLLYNAVREEQLESEGSWEIGCGVAWRHWDWRIMYYKQDINSAYKQVGLNDDKMLGCSIIYYF